VQQACYGKSGSLTAQKVEIVWVGLQNERSVSQNDDIGKVEDGSTVESQQEDGPMVSTCDCKLSKAVRVATERSDCNNHGAQQSTSDCYFYQ